MSLSRLAACAYQIKGLDSRHSWFPPLRKVREWDGPHFVLLVLWGVKSSGVRPHKCFDGCAALAFGWTVWTDRVVAYCGGHNKGFGVVHKEWGESIFGTFHNRFFTFAEVQYIHAAICGMRN